LALVAASTIVLKPAPRPEPIFSDWETERRSADVDALILAWIASHLPGTAQRGRLH
jgi:multisubunit Na+/H+ antiporter MnhE subunit